jgi:hypothetical protein
MQFRRDVAQGHARGRHHYHMTSLFLVDALMSDTRCPWHNTKTKKWSDLCLLSVNSRWFLYTSTWMRFTTTGTHFNSSRSEGLTSWYCSDWLNLSQTSGHITSELLLECNPCSFLKVTVRWLHPLRILEVPCRPRERLSFSPVTFTSPSRQTQGQYCDQATTTSFHMISNPIIQSLLTASSNKPQIKIRMSSTARFCRTFI